MPFSHSLAPFIISPHPAWRVFINGIYCVTASSRISRYALHHRRYNLVRFHFLAVAALSLHDKRPAMAFLASETKAIFPARYYASNEGLADCLIYNRTAPVDETKFRACFSCADAIAAAYERKIRHPHDFRATHSAGRLLCTEAIIIALRAVKLHATRHNTLSRNDIVERDDCPRLPASCHAQRVERKCQHGKRR